MYRRAWRDAREKCKAFCHAGRPGGSEKVAGDEPAEGDDIVISLDFEAHHADTAAEEEVELAVEIEGAGGLHGISLQFVVGESGEIHLLTGESLHIHGNHAFVREDNRIADGLEGCDNALTLHQEGADALHLALRAYRGEFEQASVFKINHGLLWMGMGLSGVGDSVSASGTGASISSFTGAGAGAGRGDSSSPELEPKRAASISLPK